MRPLVGGSKVKGFVPSSNSSLNVGNMVVQVVNFFKLHKKLVIIQYIYVQTIC